MKRLTAFVAAGVLVATAGCSASGNGPPMSGEPPMIIGSDQHDDLTWRAAGDSTLGGDNGQPGVASLLEGMRNVAVPGATLLQGISNGVPTDTPWIRNVISDANIQYGMPDKILIYGGSADSVVRLIGQSPYADQDYFDEITNLTNELINLDVDVYWLNVVPPAGSTSASYQQMRTFRQVIQGFLRDHIPADHLIDCNPAIDTDGDGWMDDQFAWSPLDRNHFSPEGTRVFSDCLAAKLGLTKIP